MRAKLEAAQLVEPPALTPKLFDLVCDATAGSTCSKVTLEATLKEILRAAAAAPGSRLRLWSLGATVGATKILGEVTTPAVTSRSRRGREAQLAEWQSTSRDKLLLTMERVFAGPPARRSPIAESISKVALAEGHALTRTMVVITDAREVATANFNAPRCSRPKKRGRPRCTASAS